MPTFGVRESQLGNFVVSSSERATTVDIGVILGGMQRHHGDMLLVSERLASEQAIDDAIESIKGELDRIRSEAKALLATLKH